MIFDEIYLGVVVKATLSIGGFKMANADLKVVKVYVQNKKQIGYEVMHVDGSIIKVGRDQMVQAISLGHKYANATISSSGVVRVSSDVPREDISATAKKSTGVLDYKGDIPGFLKDGKAINPFELWSSHTIDYILCSRRWDNWYNVTFKTKYIPSEIVDKSINRNLYRTYIDPAKAYKKYTFHVSVEEARKYGHPARVPKIEKFRDEHDTDKTTTYWATDYIYTTWFDEDMYYGYDTITVWVYVVNFTLEIAFSMICLSMINDIMDTMQSRLDDGCPLYSRSILGENATSMDATPYEIIDDTMIFYDERIYRKFMATVARYNKLK